MVRNKNVQNDENMPLVIVKFAENKKCFIYS